MTINLSFFRILMKPHMVFGYALNDGWLLEYGKRHGLTPTKEQIERSGTSPEDADLEASTVSRALNQILSQAGIRRCSRVTAVVLPDQSLACCIAFASNDPAECFPKPPPETWAKLKNEIFKIDADPSWFRFYC